MLLWWIRVYKSEPRPSIELFIPNAGIFHKQRPSYIPQNVRESMGILPAETVVEFVQDENGRWCIVKAKTHLPKASRFRTAHKEAKLTMITVDIMALARSG